MSIDPREWQERSINGELCGIVGCRKLPSIQCPECQTHYCNDHKDIHKHVIK